MTDFNTKRTRIALVLSVALLGLVALSGGAPRSAELGIAAYSPFGKASGAVVPASCPSYTHNSIYSPCTDRSTCNTSTTANASNACPGDMCFNIDGVQASPPAGYYLYETPGVYRLCCPNGYSHDTYSCYPPPPPQPPTVTCNSSASCTVLPATVVTITWSCPSPNTSSTNSFNSNTAASGSANVTVNANTTYTVHCTQTGTQASVSATVLNPQLSLTASPQKVQSGGTSTLTWSATAVQSCTLTGPGVSVSATADVNGNVSSRTTTTGAITASNTYTLTCQTSAGTATPVTVIVSPIPNVIEI